MINNTTQSRILELITREIQPAMGCTEPVAVALCCAGAAALLDDKPDSIEVWLSANMLKNAMGVGIPGTGMIGLPIAIALGTLIGRPELKLKILEQISPRLLEEGKKLIEQKRIVIHLKENVDKLYIETKVSSGKDCSIAIIAREHTRFIYQEKNGEILTDISTLRENTTYPKIEENNELKLSFDLVYRFAMDTPLEDIEFIRELSLVNKNAAELSLNADYGHTVGKIINSGQGRKFMGDTTFTRMLTATAAACDARMDGAKVMVMSNSGSGNQGIAASVPVLSFAEDIDCAEEQLTRALVLSHLMVIYIKQCLGRLSCLCGCVVASIGAASAITYLMGGNYNQIIFAVKNMVGNLTGMICDGAKPGCALKVSSGVSTAMLSALMAMENKVVSSTEGIIDEDVDQTILNLVLIGAKGMDITDKYVLNVMTHKQG